MSEAPLLGPGSPQRIRDVCGSCCGREQLPGATVEVSVLGEVRVRGPVMVRQTSSHRSGHRWSVDVSRGRRARLGHRERRKRSLDRIPIGIIGLLAPTGDEVADPQQTGPHAVVVAVLAG